MKSAFYIVETFVNYTIIDTTSALNDLCEQVSQSHWVMLDTEFVRTRTYYPQLGLIQLCDGNHLALIDPTQIEDFSAFVALLENPSVLKVLHACGEDLEVFKKHFCAPEPLMDTQVMAAFLGHGLSTGFAALVSEYLEVELDKSESRTDWLARPLSEKQLNYAAADVFYLFPLFKLLEEKLVQSGWWEAAMQEVELLVQKRFISVSPDKAYLDIKGAWQLQPRQLAILKPLATWRLEEAINRDIALNFIFKEQDLLSVARYQLNSKQKMEEKGIDYRAIRRHGDKVAAIVNKATQLSALEWPERIERLIDSPRYKKLYKQLKEVVEEVSQTSDLASEFLASKKQVNQMISWYWAKDEDPEKCPDLMQGWRKVLLGDKLAELIKGSD